MKRLRNRATGVLIAERIACPTAPWERALGYLSRRTVDPGEGLWFGRCALIHTLGMRAGIDIVFVDRDRTIVRVISRARRNRLFYGGARAAAALELAAGSAERNGLRPGDRLALE